MSIGSPYMSDLIVIDPHGNAAKRYPDKSNDQLHRYQSEMDADPAKLRELLRAPDQFEASIPVYTFDGSDIVERKCEALGWPNVTHDGDLMHDNTYSADKSEVVEWSKRTVECTVQHYRRDIKQTEQDLQALRANLAREEAVAAQLQLRYPS